MNAHDIVSELERAGVRLWEESGELRFRAPRGALTEAHRVTIAAHRDALLAVLQYSTTPILPDPSSGHHPFPLTDIQSAYLFGRHTIFGGVACHMYVEVELGETDSTTLETLEKAWNTLIARHSMLRAVIEPGGSQQVLEQVPAYRIVLCSNGLDEVRQQMSHALREPENWPLFELRLSLMPTQAILHLSIDFIIADWASIRILLGELEQLRCDPECVLAPLQMSFRDYVLAERGGRESMRFVRDRDYWLARVDQLEAAPQLPLSPKLAATADQAPRFQRLSLRMTPAQWAGLRELSARYNVTPSGAVLAAYAEVVGTWSRYRRFTLNLTLFNRLPRHPDVGNIVGDFTSVNLLAVDNEEDDSFGVRARKLSAQLFDDLDHRQFSGIEVMREISRRRGHEAALMPIVFTSAIGLNVAGAEGSSRHQSQLGWGITQTPQVWIDCQAMDWQDELLINWDVREGVLAKGVVDDMFGAFTQLLERLAFDDSAWQQQVPLSLPSDQAQRRHTANATAAPLPNGMLHEAVFATALRQPQRCAVVSGARELSYAELGNYAAAVSAALQLAGCMPGQLVAIWMDKGWEQVAAVLGVLHAGAAWLPIDTSQPPERCRQLLSDAGVCLVLTQSWLGDAAGGTFSQQLIVVDTLVPLEQPNAAPQRRARPTDLAYVIYTSGSSGKPKGVMVSHAAALNTIADINRRFAIGADDRILGLANLSFDLSIYDIFGPLSVGACLVLPDAGRRADPSHWVDLIKHQKISVWNSVPAQLQMLEHYLAAIPQHGLSSLRLAMLSGDWIPPNLSTQIHLRLPQMELVSLGGATEAAIWSIYHRIGILQPDLPSIPYGKPLANQQCHVLADGGWRDCPELVIGEIYIGGVGLAQGYLGDAVQTLQRFVVHPTSGERLYRTGDLGRYLRDGSIEFLGREDGQVKIRGNRVELAEVEAALTSHPSVREAVVVAEGDMGLNRRLVAFAVPRADLDGAVLDAEALSAHAARWLPAYMIPGRIEILATLPLSENGKIDRRALCCLAAELLTLETYADEEPRNELERQLALIWAEVLELPKVGREQDFFQLGGDSLRAARLVGRVRESVPEAAGMFFDSLIRQLLPSPTIAALAAYLESQRITRSSVIAETLPSSPLLRLDGNSVDNSPARVLVHDGAGRLAAFQTLLPVFLDDDSACRPLFGLQVNEAASYLLPGAKALLERRATAYARLLQAHGQHSLQLAGCGFGALLTLELARQLTENGVDVVSLTLLAPRALTRPIDDDEMAALFTLETRAAPAWPGVDCIDDPAMQLRIFADSVRAGETYVVSPYLGDVTLLQYGADLAGGIDWNALVIGDVRHVDIGASVTANELANLLFAPTATTEARS